MSLASTPNPNQPMTSVPIKQEDLDADPDLVPLSGDAWGYPAGCPVAFHFRPAPLGRGDADFEAGAIRSVLMDRSTREIIFAVERRGREGESVLIPEKDIGYAAGCPITVRMAGQCDADGEVMFAMPKFDGSGDVESISYAVVIMLDGGKYRIMSNVPANQIKYREVAGEDAAVTSKAEEPEDESCDKPSKETLSRPRPSSKPETRPSQGAAPMLSVAEHVKTKRREFERESDRNRKQPAARSQRKQTKPAIPSARGASAKKKKRNESITDSAEDESDSDGYKKLKVGSRVNVLFHGTEWQATILGDKVKNGELGLVVHYDGSKANSSGWVSVDKVVSLVV